jgi:hypothetical protein
MIYEQSSHNQNHVYGHDKAKILTKIALFGHKLRYLLIIYNLSNYSLLATAIA